MKLSDLEALLSKGLISQEQKSAIVEQLHLTRSSSSRNYLLIAFSSLGALLVLMGIILLISANWEKIPSIVKQIPGILLMLGFWGLGLKLIFKVPRSPRIGEALCFLGAGMWLANIALYGQIYQISSTPSRAIALWFCGIFLFPWIVRLRGVLLMSIVAAFIWVCVKAETAAMMSCAAGPSYYYFHFLAFFAVISALGIFISTFPKASQERFRGYDSIAIWSTYPLLILLAQGPCYTTINFSINALFSLIPACAILCYAQIRHARQFSQEKKTLSLVFAILLGLFPLIPLVISILHGFSYLDRGSSSFLMILILFLIGFISMIYGALSTKLIFVNGGAFMILLGMLAVISKVIGSLIGNGIALIFAGLIFLGIGFFIERQRQKIMAKIKVQNAVLPQ